MKRKIFAFVAASVMVLNFAGSTVADTKSKKLKRAQADALVALLPASDGIAVFDAKRFFSEALPTVLASNQPMLGEILGKVDEMKAKTGIDFRQFEQVAVGVSMKQISATETDFDPVAVARGNFSSGALVAVAKLASNGTYREEKIGDRTVYVFSVKELAAKHAPKPGNSKIAGAIERTVNGLTKEIAVTSIDTNTLAIGSLARVRQTLSPGVKGDAELSGFLSRRPGSVVSFAARTPTGLSKHMPLENDELGKNLDAIRFLYGSLDVAAGNASFQALARTVRPEQAQGLLETLEGLQLVGKAFIGGGKGPDKEVYGRMIDNAKFSRAGNEVALDLTVPQSDIDVLVGTKK